MSPEVQNRCISGPTKRTYVFPLNFLPAELITRDDILEEIKLYREQEAPQLHGNHLTQI